MQGGVVREHSTKYHIFMDISTATYIFLMLYGLYYTGAVLKIGSFESIYIVFLFVTLEIVKFYVCGTLCQIQTFKSMFKDFSYKLGSFLKDILFVYIIAVLLGAPLLSDFHETAMFAIYLTVFSVFPMYLYFNNDQVNSFSIAQALVYSNDELNLPELNFKLKTKMILFSAWLGAVVIPLDWNRPWQQWPIPCCIGVFVGSALSNCIALSLYIIKQ